MDLATILARVPELEEFLTPEELLQHSRELAKSFPAVVKFEVVGESKEGREIGLLKIGRGQNVALLYGFPHPDEPIGSLTLEFFSEFLAENNQLRKKLNFSWLIIKCIDPDGATRNQGWFKGTFDPIRFFLNYYRQRDEEQIDWSFPVEYKKLKRTNPPPETQVIIDLIHEYQPVFMASLHNAPFFGVHAYVNKNIPKVFQEIIQIADKEDLPMHSTASLWPFQETFSRGIYSIGGVRHIYDYYEQNNPKLIDSLGLAAFSGEYYDLLNPKGFFINMEVPFYFSWELTDQTKSNLTLLETEKIIAQHMIENIKFLEDFWPKIKERVDKTSSYYLPAQDYIENWLSNIQEEIKSLENDPKFQQKATKADEFYAKWVQKYNKCFALGQTCRLIKEAALRKDDPVLIKIHEKIYQEIKEIDRAVRNKVEVVFPSIKSNVRVQLGAILAAVNYYLSNGCKF